MAAVAALHVSAARRMNRGLIAALLFGGVILGVFHQHPAQINGATVLWSACSIALIFVIARAPHERKAMLDIATLPTGSPVIVNRMAGPDLRVYDAIFLGSTGQGATVQIVGSLFSVYTIAHNDPKAWIEDPRTGQTYGRVEDEPVLVGATPDLE